MHQKVPKIICLTLFFFGLLYLYLRRRGAGVHQQRLSPVDKSWTCWQLIVGRATIIIFSAAAFHFAPLWCHHLSEYNGSPQTVGLGTKVIPEQLHALAKDFEIFLLHKQRIWTRILLFTQVIIILEIYRTNVSAALCLFVAGGLVRQRRCKLGKSPLFAALGQKYTQASANAEKWQSMGRCCSVAALVTELATSICKYWLMDGAPIVPTGILPPEGGLATAARL